MSKHVEQAPKAKRRLLGVRLTERQFAALATADYRTPQQELQRLVDGAIATEYFGPVDVVNEFDVPPDSDVDAS